VRSPGGSRESEPAFFLQFRFQQRRTQEAITSSPKFAVCFSLRSCFFRWTSLFILKMHCCQVLRAVKKDNGHRTPGLLILYFGCMSRAREG
jgi:hypothetical protein